MNIIFNPDADHLHEKFIMLELDTFADPDHGQKRTAWCLIEKLCIEDYTNISAWIQAHANLMINYRLQHWTYCEQAIEKLMGRWNGEVDSFYSNLLQRIHAYQQLPPQPGWTGVIDRTIAQDA